MSRSSRTGKSTTTTEPGRGTPAVPHVAGSDQAGRLSEPTAEVRPAVATTPPAAATASEARNT